MLKKHISGHFSVGTVHISNKMYIINVDGVKTDQHWVPSGKLT